MQKNGRNRPNAGKNASRHRRKSVHQGANSHHDARQAKLLPHFPAAEPPLKKEVLGKTPFPPRSVPLWFKGGKGGKGGKQYKQTKAKRKGGKERKRQTLLSRICKKNPFCPPLPPLIAFCSFTKAVLRARRVRAFFPLCGGFDPTLKLRNGHFLNLAHSKAHVRTLAGSKGKRRNRPPQPNCAALIQTPNT